MSYAGSGWSCITGQPVTADLLCERAAPVAAGEDVPAVTLVYRTPDVEQYIYATATVSSSTEDPDHNNNQSVIGTNVRQCTVEDYPQATVTPDYTINRNKAMVKATISSTDCGDTSQKVTVPLR